MATASHRFKSEPGVAPFSTSKLDLLMDDAGLDLLIVSSKHNVQYMLGGYRSSFFHFTDAIGTSRYLPVFVYPKGMPDKAAFFGHKLEVHDRENDPFWVTHSTVECFGVADTIQQAVAYMSDQGLNTANIGLENDFLPVQAYKQLQAAFPQASFHDALFPLERMRAIKMAWEVKQLRSASEKVLASMQATFKQITPGMSKAEVIHLMRQEEALRDLTFEYCWLSVGPNLNRTASQQPLTEGVPISIDSGANYNGYVGDLARMAVIGEPDAELVGILDAIEEIQETAFALIKPGCTGHEIHSAASARLNKLSIGPHSHFVAHGMGLITHEAPRLTSDGSIRYEGYDADKPLQSGMVLSVETTVADPNRGAVKLEDSLLVTDTGFEFLGNGLRGWNQAGS